jgi:hypothetical protein
VSFVAVILLVASQRAFIVVSVHFVMDSVRKLLDTPVLYSNIIFCLMFLLLSSVPFAVFNGGADRVVGRSL